MRITIVTHAARGSRVGNRITAERWGKIIRSLGHRVTIATDFEPNAELLIAIHARRTAKQIARFAKTCPNRPIVLALSGTDVYRDLSNSVSARESIARASRIVALQERAVDPLPKSARGKTRVIFQSAKRPRKLPRKLSSCFEVSVCCHLRKEKDPLRCALAARLLPSSSNVRVNHVGRALTQNMERQAIKESLTNDRYRWVGEKPPATARWLIARSRLMVNSSTMEGGANVISEALVSGVPVLASKVSGNVGMLGTNYVGYFPLNDTAALAELIDRAETDSGFYRKLQSYCRKRSALFSYANEKAAWRRLLAELK